MAIDPEVARRLAAVLLPGYPSRLNESEFEPGKLYLLHPTPARGIAATANGAAEAAAASAGHYAGWYQRRSAVGSSVEEVLERLEYPVNPDGDPSGAAPSG